MKATFLRDEHNNLWLFDAEDIRVRQIAIRLDEHCLATKMDYFNCKTREHVIRELDEFSTQYKLDCSSVDTIYKLMRKNYECMKRQVGILAPGAEDRDRLHVDEAFRRLRPSSPYKMSEMIDPDFSPKKKVDELRREGKGTIFPAGSY